MKNRLLSLTLMLFSSALIAQLTTDHSAPGFWSGTAIGAGSSRSVIWSEDFSSGIPDDWINEEAGGIAHWEYRGPETDPAIDVGSRGSCNSNGIGPSIQSPTKDNGFVIFDSNYWDSPEGLCSAENIGTGPAPGPHLATLTTSSIDLSASNNVAIRFHQFLRYFQGTIRVEYSLNNGAWTTLYSPTFPQGFTSQNSQLVSAALPPETQGATDIRFRFVYQGLYYHWQIDDIEIYEIFANDLEIQSKFYGNYSTDDPGNFSGLEYSYYPVTMPPILKFSAFVQNIGQNTQTNCKLNVLVKNAVTGNVLHTAQSPSDVSLLLGEGTTLSAGEFQMPAAVGTYRIVYIVTQDESDGNPANSKDSLDFKISSTTWARDRFQCTSVYAPSMFADASYVAGNIFTSLGGSFTPQYMQIGVGEGSIEGGRVFGAIYEFDFDDFSQIQLIASTDTSEIDMAMLNGLGSELLMDLYFQAPPVLVPGKTYLVTAGSPDGAGIVKFATSGSSPDFSSWVIFEPQMIFYLTRIPMVRLVSSPLTQISEYSDIEKPVVYPNPASDHCFVKSNSALGMINRIIIRDQMGRMISSQKAEAAGTLTYRVDISQLSFGSYLLEMHGEGGNAVIRLLKN